MDERAGCLSSPVCFVRDRNLTHRVGFQTMSNWVVRLGGGHGEVLRIKYQAEASEKGDWEISGLYFSFLCALCVLCG
jgi:hypothetical protein